VGFGGGQAGEVGAGAGDQGPPTAAPRLRVHGDAGGRQGLEVAACRGHGHLELCGQLGGGHPAAGLEQEEGRDKAISAHESIVAR
jgi:hypothetical protein